MKTLIFTLILITSSTGICLDLITLDGKKYTAANLLTTTPNSIKIMHDSGVSTLYFTNLTAEVQKQYGYNVKKAAEFEAQEKAKELKVQEEQSARKAVKMKKEAEDAKLLAEQNAKNPPVTAFELRALANTVDLDTTIQLTTSHSIVVTGDQKSNNRLRANQQAKTLSLDSDTVVGHMRDVWHAQTDKATALLSRPMPSSYATWLNLFIQASNDAYNRKGEALHDEATQLRNTLP